MTYVNGVEIGQGLVGTPEPKGGVVRQWSIAVHSDKFGTYRMFFYRLADGRTMSYNPAYRRWKIWRPKKPLVIGKHVTISKAKRMVRKLNDMRKIVDSIFGTRHTKAVKKKKR